MRSGDVLYCLEDGDGALASTVVIHFEIFLLQSFIVGIHISLPTQFDVLLMSVLFEF